jgi:hypothetical protein
MALAASAIGYAAILAALRRADASITSTAEAERKWWLGYARDGTNLAAFLAFSLGYSLLGLPGPLAFLAGATLALLGYGLDHLFAVAVALPRATATTGAVLVGLTVLSAALRDPLARGLRAILRGLF